MRCGRRWRQRVRVVVDGRVHPMTADGDGWWRADGDRSRPPIPTTASCSTTTRTRCPTRARAGSRTASTRSPAASTRREFAWTDDRWTGRQLAGGIDLRAARRNVHPGRHARRRRSTSSTTWSTSVSTSSSCCRSTASAAPTTGATTACSGTPSTTATAARRRTCGSSTPATVAAWRSSRTSCTTTSGRAATTCPRFGPYLHDERSNTWGPSINLDSVEVRRYILDNARDVDARLPRRRSAPRRRARARRHVAGSHPAGARRGDRRPLGVPRPPPHAHRRVRSQRSEADHAAGGGRVRAARAVERRLPPRRARRAHRRDDRLLRRLRAPRGPRQGR